MTRQQSRTVFKGRPKEVACVAKPWRSYNLCRCRRCEWGRNLLRQSPFRGSRSSCNPCSYLNERQLGVDTFVSVASKARGRSHQKTKIINFVGCFQTKKCMRFLSPCRDLAMSCGCPAQQYARICDRQLGQF